MKRFAPLVLAPVGASVFDSKNTGASAQIQAAFLYGGVPLRCVRRYAQCLYTHNAASSGDGRTTSAAGCASARARFISKCHFQIS
jgi:hypothetical protein